MLPVSSPQAACGMRTRLRLPDCALLIGCKTGSGSAFRLTHSRDNRIRFFAVRHLQSRLDDADFWLVLCWFFRFVRRRRCVRIRLETFRLLAALNERLLDLGVRRWRNCTRRHDAAACNTDAGHRLQAGQFTLEEPAHADARQNRHRSSSHASDCDCTAA